MKVSETNHNIIRFVRQTLIIFQNLISQCQILQCKKVIPPVHQLFILSPLAHSVFKHLLGHIQIAFFLCSLIEDSRCGHQIGNPTYILIPYFLDNPFLTVFLRQQIKGNGRFRQKIRPAQFLRPDIACQQ